MIITKVHYTVRAGYAVINKKNIARVMAQLKTLNYSDVRYSAFSDDDEKTFVHLGIYADEEAKKRFTSMASFKVFQADLLASDPETNPVVTNLILEGSSGSYF